MIVRSILALAISTTLLLSVCFSQTKSATEEEAGGQPFQATEVKPIFCGCRTLRFLKGAGFDVAVRPFLCSPLAQLHPRNVVALAGSFTFDHRDGHLPRSQK
jgi:hypothetical protein